MKQIFPLLAGLLLASLSLATRSAPPEFGELAGQIGQYRMGASRSALDRVNQWIRESQPSDPARAELARALASILATDASIDAKRFVCEKLWQLGSNDVLTSVEPLLLEEPSAHIACYALRNFPPGPADAALRDALRRAPQQARMAIIQLLGDRRDSAAVPVLRHFLGQNTSVTSAAIAALGQIATPEALEALAAAESTLPALKLKLAEAQLAAAEQLGPIHRRLARETFERLCNSEFPFFIQRAALLGAIRTSGDQALPRLLAALEEQEPRLQTAAIAEIAALENPGTSARMLQQLERFSPPVQALIIEALSDRRDPELRAPLATLAAHPEPRIAIAALKGLRNVGDATSLRPLLDVVKSPATPEIKGAATEALRHLEGPRIDAQILSTVRELGLAHSSVVASLIADRQIREGIPLLLEIARGSDPVAAAEAFRSLARMATPALAPLLIQATTENAHEQAFPDAERAIVQSLRDLEHADARVQPVIDALSTDPSPRARVALVRVLSALGGNRALEAVRAQLDPTELTVRDAAFRSLVEWPDSAALPELFRLASEAERPAQRVLALRGHLRLLGQLPAENAQSLVRDYKRALDLAQRNEERVLILSGLARLADPSALELAAALMDQPALAAEAALATLQIAEKLLPQNPAAAKPALLKLEEHAPDAKIRARARELNPR